MAEKKFIEIVHCDTDEVVYRSDVTGRSKFQIEKIQAGMLINLHNDYIVRVTTKDAK